MNVISQKTKEDYIRENQLQESFLPVNILYMCRGTIPARKDVGIIEDYKIFFEEGISSLKRRYYKQQNKVTSWNLVLSNGKTTSLLSVADKEWLLNNKNKIKFNSDNNYTIDFLINFLETKSKKRNLLNPISEEEKKYRYQKWLTKEEIILVNKLIERLREMKKEEN